MTDQQTVTSIDAWAANAIHQVLCPSGSRVKIKIPDLAAMAEVGQIPNHLLDLALGVANGDVKKADIEMVKKQREFTDLIVLATVVEPQLDESSVKRVPVEDKDMLVSLATRSRDLDAEGEHIDGLTKSEKFRRFRRLGEFVEDVEGL